LNTFHPILRTNDNNELQKRSFDQEQSNLEILILFNSLPGFLNPFLPTGPKLLNVVMRLDPFLVAPTVITFGLLSTTPLIFEQYWEFPAAAVSATPDSVSALIAGLNNSSLQMVK
jgi:hypothetical protein